MPKQNISKTILLYPFRVRYTGNSNKNIPVLQSKRGIIDSANKKMTDYLLRTMCSIKAQLQSFERIFSFLLIGLNPIGLFFAKIL